MYKLTISSKEYPFTSEYGLAQAQAQAAYILGTVAHRVNFARLYHGGKCVSIAQRFEGGWSWATVGGAK